MDDQTFPRDPFLPQLQIAWNPELMLEVFRHTLRPFGEIEYDILSCKLSRFRYRQGIRSIVLYQLILRERGTGVERNLWVSGVTYPDDRANRLYHQILSSNAGQRIPESLLWVEPVSYIPELKMLIQVFPQDHFLLTLPLLIAGPPEKLERFFLEHFGPGSWRMERCEVEPVRYRPFIGATLRYKIEAMNTSVNSGRTKYFYVKIYREKSVRQAYELFNKVYLSTSSAGKGFTTVKPLAYFEDLQALVLEAAPGKSLEQLILQDENVDAAILKSARALAEFHQSKMAFTQYRSMQETLLRASKAGRFIQWACPDLSGKVNEIMNKLKLSLKDVPPCPTHLDIKAGHIFIDDDKAVFIDLDSFALSDPVFDPASLLIEMEMRPSLSSIHRSTVDALSKAFLKEYFARVPGNWYNRLPVNYSCAALKAALYYLQHQEPFWSKHVVMIVNRAIEALSGQVFR